MTSLLHLDVFAAKNIWFVLPCQTGNILFNLTYNSKTETPTWGDLDPPSSVSCFSQRKHSADMAGCPG